MLLFRATRRWGRRAQCMWLPGPDQALSLPLLAASAPRAFSGPLWRPASSVESCPASRLATPSPSSIRCAELPPSTGNATFEHPQKPLSTTLHDPRRRRVDLAAIYWTSSNTNAEWTATTATRQGHEPDMGEGMDLLAVVEVSKPCYGGAGLGRSADWLPSARHAGEPRMATTIGTIAADPSAALNPQQLAAAQH